MKIIDKTDSGITDLNWSPDGKNLVWVCEGVIKKYELEKEAVSEVTRGTNPGFNQNNDIVFGREDEIWLHTASSETTIVKKNDLITGTVKRRPRTSLNGKIVLFVIDNVFSKESLLKNAYPYRSFLGKVSADGSKDQQVLQQQWYGGTISWMPGSQKFVHFEYDSTGGARIHISDLEGNDLGLMFGLYPSVSPDLKSIACKPRGGQNVVVYTSKGDDSWAQDNLLVSIIKLPEGGKLTGNPPLWLDNRRVLIDEGGGLFLVDVKNQEVKDLSSSLSIPTVRGGHTMSISPDRKSLAMETGIDSFELILVDIDF